MKILLVLLVVDLTTGNLLNREYLPPPGAHLSGGILNHNDLPLELPKEQILLTDVLDNLKTFPEDEVTKIGSNVDAKATNVPGIYDVYYNTPPMYSTTTLSPHMELYSTVPLQTSTGISGKTDFVIKVTEPDFKTTQYDDFVRHNVPFTSQFSTLNMNDGNTENLPNTELASTSSPTTVTSSLVTNGDYETTTYNMPEQNPSTLFPERKQSFYDRTAITSNQNNVLAPDDFSYSFDTSNGLHSYVSGTANNGVKTKGTYSYVGDDGKLYKMEYTADENGFQPRGDHIPTSPPIPKEIQNVIEQAYKDKAAGIFDDGSYSEEKYGYKKYMPQTGNTKKISFSQRPYTSLGNSDDLNKQEPKYHRIPNNYITTKYDNPDDISSTVGGSADNIIPVQIIYEKGYEYFPPQNGFYLMQNSKLKPTKNDKNILAPKEEQLSQNPDYNLAKIVPTSDRFDYNPPGRNVNELSKESYSTNDGFENNPGILNTGNTYYSENEGTDYTRPISTHIDSSTPDENLRETFSPSATETPYLLGINSAMDNGDSNYTLENNNASELPILENSGTTYREDFSGPKQRPRYDPSGGYYY